MSRIRLLPLLGSLFLLAACGGSSQPQQATATAAVAAQPAAPVQQAPAVQPVPKKQTPSVPAPQAAVPPTPEPVDDNPLQFMELSSAQVSERVGRPHFVRRDGTAEVWQYRGEGCFLDLFLYQQDTGFFVKYVDLRSQQLGGERLRACLADIIRKRSHTKIPG